MAGGRPPRMARAQQERELLEAARSLFDERGVPATQIEDVASRAGISKGLVYRYFASKDELYLSALLVYLEELGALLEAVPRRDDVVDELLDITHVYVCYGIDHPAFLDCSLSLLRLPAGELIQQVSPANALRLGREMARGLAVFVRLLARAREAGVLDVEDPDLWANYWYTRALGSLQLARSGVILTTAEAPLPSVRPLATDELTRIALEDLLADVGVANPRARVVAWLRANVPASAPADAVGQPSKAQS